MARIDYVIKEPNGQFNVSRTYNKKKLYDSHGQGYSRRGDCLKVHNANFKDNAKMVDVTRAEFDRLFKPAPKKKVKKK